MKNFEEESLIEDAKNLKILYVESDKEIRHQLSNILNKYFEEVISTPYADNALKIFGSGFFDLIITDIDLPDMDAEIICFKIKKAAPRKPIVLISKNDNLEKLINLVNIGIAGYIRLPLNKNSVIKILSNVVNNIIDLKMMYNYQDTLEGNQQKIKSTPKKDEKPKTASDLLLTQHKSIISAKEFLDRYPITLSSSLDTISNVTEDLDMHINSFIHDPSSQNIEILAKQFEIFSSTLTNIEEFQDMSFVINKLAIIFRGLEPNKNYREYADVFLAISSSITKWFEDIFINKTTSNIHFLDHSMLADVLTLEDLFREGETSQNDGIEFF